MSSASSTTTDLKHKLGQLFVLGFPGDTPTPEITALIRDHHVGGIILFSRNVSTPRQLLALTHALQTTARDAGHALPLLLGTDQENGLVTRLKPPRVAAQLPGAMALGALPPSVAAGEIEAVAHATADTLAFYGLNTNYAPVCDVNSEPRNPVIGVRSPGDDAAAVGRVAATTVRGLQQRGVVACAKHFPGHGDTAVDSHRGLPVVAKTREQLEACEFVPFRRVVAGAEGERVECVMMAHIALPGLRGAAAGGGEPAVAAGGKKEELLPASLSPRAVGLLRKELAYDGVIVTDCLEMGAIAQTHGSARAAVLALKAGADQVMVSHTASVQQAALHAVLSAAQSGELPLALIDAAVARVRRLKERYLSWPAALSPKSDDEMAAFGARRAAHEALAQRVYEQATTVVRAAAGALPLPASATVAVLSPREHSIASGAVDGEEAAARSRSHELVTALRAHCASVLDIRFPPAAELPAEVVALVARAGTLVFASKNAQLFPYQRELGRTLVRRFGAEKRIVFVAACDPVDFLDDAALAATYVACYESTPPAFRAVAEVLCGNVVACGVLPVRSRAGAAAR